MQVLSDYKIDKMAFMHLITQLNKLKGGDVEIVVIFIMCSFVQYYVIIQWETGHVYRLDVSKNKNFVTVLLLI